MADDKWLQVHARKDKLRRWLKARSLKTTGRKQKLIDRVIKAKKDGTETIEELHYEVQRLKDYIEIINLAPRPLSLLGILKEAL